MKIAAEECDPVFALSFLLTTLVNIFLPVLFHFLQSFRYQTWLKRGIQIDENLTLER